MEYDEVVLGRRSIRGYKEEPVPKQVIERLNRFMISTKVQPYASYEMSDIAGKNQANPASLIECLRFFKNLK